nr:DUF4352 domain-containing protein [Streptomyces sp. NBC_00974]
MSTPPNPPSTPSVPPAEPTGTPAPEAASIPEPAQPLSLKKAPSAPESAPEPASEPTLVSAAEPIPNQAPDQTPAPDQAAAPAQAPTPDQAAAPAAPAAPASVTPPAAFAPVTPAPPYAGPAGPAYGAPYGAPANLWAAPGGSHPGHPGPPPATNGMAVAALVFGIAGILLGLVPFLFWAGALLALVGLGLGIAAVVRSRGGAPRGAMAVAGTVLGLLGLGASVGGYFITRSVVDKIDAKMSDDRPYEDDGLVFPSSPPLPTQKPSPSPSQVPGLTSALPFGQTFTYPSGVEVKVSEPKKYVTDSEYIKVGNAVEVTLTVTNNSTETLDIIYAVPNIRDEQGLAGKLVFDGEMPKMIKGAILPGASATGVIAYEVPKGTATLTADITPGGRLPSVKYSGPIG